MLARSRRSEADPNSTQNRGDVAVEISAALSSSPCPALNSGDDEYGQAGQSELPVHPAGRLKLGARISSCQSNGRQRPFNICQCASLPFSSGDIWGWLEHSAGVLSEDHDPACRTSHKCCTQATTWTPQHQTPTRFPINLLSASPPEAPNQPPQADLPCCLVTYS